VADFKDDLAADREVAIRHDDHCREQQQVRFWLAGTAETRLAMLRDD